MIWRAIAEKIAAMEAAQLHAMGLTTPDLRARYAFWRAMGNASPRCKRWAFHPHVTYSNCDPEPWFA